MYSAFRQASQFCQQGTYVLVPKSCGMMRL
jgi:hypothetical protein